MRLLEVGIRWPPETFLRWKLQSLALNGFDVTVASSAVFDPGARLDGVEMIRIPSRRMTRAAALRAIARDGIPLLSSPRRLVALLRGIGSVPAPARTHYGGRLRLLAMYAQLARLRPDVVHFEWTTSATAYMPLFDVWGCPVVVSCHGTIDTRAPGREHHLARLPELFRRTAAVHCVSESIGREAASLGMDPAKARLIRQAVDPAIFHPRATPDRQADGPFRIVTVGWLRWMKGYEYALEAIRELVAHGVPVRYEIVGNDPPEHNLTPGERERIAYTTTDLKLEADVVMRGALGTEQLVRALQRSDVLLHPSVDEGFPTVLLEAMSCGVPILATDCGGVAEMFTPGLEGLLVRPRDSGALADALLELWRSPQLRAQMGSAGRAAVSTGYTLAGQCEQFQGLYRELASVT